MWKYLSSWIWGSEPAELLSVDEAYNILEEAKSEEVQEDNSDAEQDESDYLLCQKTGVITEISGTTLKIDDIYSYTCEDESFRVGSKISYKVYKTGHKFKVTEVNLIESDWDLIETKKSTWCERVMVCQVEKRDGRNIILKENQLTVDLNDVTTEFIPIVGDWLQLEVKCEIDESVSDLCGKVLEVTKISPVRPHVKQCKITNYDVDLNAGTIDTFIYFNGDSLPFGFVPVKGDSVVAEVIESEQGSCTWRALKIITEGKIGINQLIIDDSSIEDVVFCNEKISIQSETILVNDLQKNPQFFVLIENSSEFPVLIKNITFPKTQQCKVVVSFESYELKGNETKKIICKFEGKRMGENKELLVVECEDVKLGHWIRFSIGKQNRKEVQFVRKYNRYINHPTSELIKGQQLTSQCRYVAIKIPPYTVLKKLLDIYADYTTNEHNKIREELKKVKPCLFTNLTAMNYEDRYHTMLYLEEISQMIYAQNYNQDLACFIHNGDFLMLEIPNLLEKRPSLIPGDTIVATHPTKPEISFEGIIHKTTCQHVYLKFSQTFHETYTGEDYSIRVVCSRGLYRRLHHAVYLAMSNLGRDILFCHQLKEKPPNVNVKLESMPTKLTPSQALKIIQDIKNGKTPSNTNKDNLKLVLNGKTVIEWYNKSLNIYQKAAVTNILLGTARPLPYIVFGPPGTGKTVTLIETILQILRLIPHSRLLVTAPSNSAADLLAMRLVDSGVLKPGDLVRLISYSYMITENLPEKLVPYSATVTIGVSGTINEGEMHKSGLRLGCSSASIGRHRITVTTCGTTGKLFQCKFRRDHFTHIVVDEAGQAMEPEVLMPISFLNAYSGQVILAGDPLQLGPVITNYFAKENGLSESLMERLLNRFPYLKDAESFPETAGYDPRLVTQLRYNYRAVETLLKLTSSIFYANQLLPTISDTDSKEGLALQRLKEILPGTRSGKVPCIVFHGVNGENLRSPDSPSWYNPHEAAQIFYYVNELYRMSVKSSDIGIITPYLKQGREIRSVLNEAEFDLPKIGSVEEFQGQEFPIILVSTVRSHESYIRGDVEANIGFVSCPRRINVTISRAQMLLIIVGCPNVLTTDVTWRTIIKYCIDHGSYIGCELPNSYDC